MSPYLIIASYILLSVLLAYLGRHTRLKFWGVLMASLIFSPLIVGIILLFFSTTKSQPKTTDKVAPPEPQEKKQSLLHK